MQPSTTDLRRLGRRPAHLAHHVVLRPNPVAQRELRLFGKYRVLFSVDDAERTVTLLLVGEKVGNRLLVMGQEFSDHHESHPPE